MIPSRYGISFLVESQSWQDLPRLAADDHVGEVVPAGGANVEDGQGLLELLLGLQGYPVARVDLWQMKYVF